MLYDPKNFQVMLYTAEEFYEFAKQILILINISSNLNILFFIHSNSQSTITRKQLWDLKSCPLCSRETCLKTLVALIYTVFFTVADWQSKWAVIIAFFKFFFFLQQLKDKKIRIKINGNEWQSFT